MPLSKSAGHFWPLLWVVATLAIAGVLVLEDRFGRPTVGDESKAPANVAEARLLPAFRLQQETQSGTQTIERPLFVPDRRPAPAAQPVAVASIKKGQFILQATVLVGPLAIAMLKEVSTGTIHRIERGGEIQGMTLAEVTPELAVLKSGGDSETLPLLVSRGGGNVAAAVQTGPFGPTAARAPGSAAVPAIPPGASPVGAPAIAGGATEAPSGRRSPPSLGAGGSAPNLTAGALSGPVPVVNPASAAMTPDEIIARRRAASQAQ